MRERERDEKNGARIVLWEHHHKHIQKNVILCTIYYHPKRAEHIYATRRVYIYLLSFSLFASEQRQETSGGRMMFAATDASRVFIYHCAQQRAKTTGCAVCLFGAICACVYRIVCFNLRRSPFQRRTS